MPAEVAGGAAALVAAYFIGAIPWAFVVGKANGIDVRKLGSGNVGATNTFRLLGYRAGLIAAALDILKGWAAVALASVLVPYALHDWFLPLVGVAAMLGHSYSPFIGFKGGKGVAVAAGVLLFITPIAVAILLPTFVIVIALTRYVSLGSIVVAALYPFIVIAFYGMPRSPFGYHPWLVGFAVVAAAVVLYRHRPNMKRLLAHEEAKIQFRRGGSKGREGEGV